MTSSGRDARRPPAAMTPAGNGPGGRPAAAGPGTRAATRMIVLAGAVHMLRSRRFYERVIVAAIGLAALAKIGQENQASSLARLQAWDKRQIQRLEHKARTQRRAVKGARQMMRSDVSGRMARTRHGT